MHRSTSDPTQLPTFDEMCAAAYRMLGDTLDELRSDWRPGTGPNDKQWDALQDVRAHISKAKDGITQIERRAD